MTHLHALFDGRFAFGVRKRGWCRVSKHAQGRERGGCTCPPRRGSCGLLCLQNVPPSPRLPGQNPLSTSLLTAYSRRRRPVPLLPASVSPPSSLPPSPSPPPSPHVPGTDIPASAARATKPSLAACICSLDMAMVLIMSVQQKASWLGGCDEMGGRRRREGGRGVRMRDECGGRRRETTTEEGKKVCMRCFCLLATCTLHTCVPNEQAPKSSRAPFRRTHKTRKTGGGVWEGRNRFLVKQATQQPTSPARTPTRAVAGSVSQAPLCFLLSKRHMQALFLPLCPSAENGPWKKMAFAFAFAFASLHTSPTSGRSVHDKKHTAPGTRSSKKRHKENTTHQP